MLIKPNKWYEDGYGRLVFIITTKGSDSYHPVVGVRACKYEEKNREDAITVPESYTRRGQWLTDMKYYSFDLKETTKKAPKGLRSLIRSQYKAGDFYAKY